MILYLRVVPGFGVAMEESRRPDLRARPLVIGGLPHQRGSVREANLPAQRCGIRPGMALAQAHQQCPDAVFLTPALDRYELLWAEICDLLRRYTPLVESVETGQAVCDLSGCEGLWSEGWRAGRAVAAGVERSTGIAPAIGIASSRVVAELASLYAGADGVAAIDRGQERAFLGELPLTLLPDVDPHLALTFNVLGLRTIGQLAALPARAVKQRFGVQGERLHRYAHGIDERPVVPSATQASIATRYECEDGTMEEAMQGLRTLAERCAAELARLGTAGRLIGLTLIWEEAAVPSLRLLQGEEDGVPPPRRALPPGVARQGGQVLPIPYRVHSSRLPQPPVEERGEPGSVDLPVTAPAPPSSPSEPTGRSSKAVAVARTPIDTAAALLDRAERLLEQCRPHADDGAAVPRLQAIELKVSEFTQPAQLSFADFDRLDQTGALRGLSVERRRALAHEDEIFEARYGSAAFRHVTGVDPGNILTERRFRWQSGLPWEGGEAKRKRP